MNDKALLLHMDNLTLRERKHQAEWLKALVEIDERRLYSLAGYQSLWEYVTKHLKFSEGTASKRIQVMRTAKSYPIIFDLIGENKISMTAVSRLSPHLTPANHGGLLSEACGISVRATEEVVARIAPKPDVKDSIRASSLQTELVMTPLPDRPRQRFQPLSEERFHMNFTVGKTAQRKFQRLKGLKDISMEEVFLKGLETLLEQHDPELKFATSRKTTPRPSKHTRYVPRVMKRQLFVGGSRCAYVSPEGRQCEATTQLQVDHIKPWGLGGSSKDPNNLRLLCRSHNLFLAMQNYGKGYIQDRIELRQERSVLK